MQLVILVGIGLFALTVLNAYKFGIQRRDTQLHGKSSRLGNWAWLISATSLLFAYFAPISLIMAGIDFKRTAAKGQPLHILRPARMAVLNSTWAIITAVATLGLFLFRWTD